MLFGIILTRVLFVTCMVFIIGYVFGSFSKKPVLKTLTRVAAILVIVLFIGMNIFFMAGRRHGSWCPFGDRYEKYEPSSGNDGSHARGMEKHHDSL